MQKTETRIIPQKILIMGDAGRGKSTLASLLSKKLNIDHHSTDDYYYEIKFSKPKEKQQSILEISKLFHTQRWIIEGTTHHLLEPGLAAADMIIYLTHKNILYQWVCLVKRHFQRDNESWRDLFQLMRHVLYKRYGLRHKKGKKNNAEFIALFKEKVVTLSSFKEIDNFINNL